MEHLPRNFGWNMSGYGKTGFRRANYVLSNTKQYTSKFTTAARGFHATTWLSCYYRPGDLQTTETAAKLTQPSALPVVDISCMLSVQL